MVGTDALRSAKNDELYARYGDIEVETNAYVGYDPDAFRGKRILLPRDDQEWSEFTPRFSVSSDRFGLGKLILTPYA